MRPDDRVAQRKNKQGKHPHAEQRKQYLADVIGLLRKNLLNFNGLESCPKQQVKYNECYSCKNRIPQKQHFVGMKITGHGSKIIQIN